MGSDGSQTRKTGEGGGECRAWLLQCMRHVTMHMQETGLGEKGVALFQVVSGMCVCPSVGKCLRVVVTKGVTHLRVVVIKVVTHLRVVAC